jgi:hypothetical protein
MIDMKKYQYKLVFRILAFYLLICGYIGVKYWRANVWKNTMQVNFAYDESNIDYFSDRVIGLSSYEDIPDWLYRHMAFVKDRDRFTRYGSYSNCMKYGALVPQLIFEGRLGKCEEFSILAATIGVCLGYDVRIVKVYAPGNHAFIEINVNGKWIHMDPSEKIIDDPGYYTRNNWTLGPICAFSRFSREDVTQKYHPK